jgi:hypothetical protein
MRERALFAPTHWRIARGNVNGEGSVASSACHPGSGRQCRAIR